MVSTYTDVLKGKVLPVHWEEYAGHQRIDYVDTGEMPKLRFEWVSRVQIYISAVEARAARAAGHEVLAADYPVAGREFLMWGAPHRDGQIATSVRWFANHRRNSWAWTHEPDGKSGYQKHRVMFTDYYGVTPTSISALLEGTLIVAIAQCDVPAKLKYHTEVQPLWEELFTEAREDSETVTELFRALEQPRGAAIDDCIVNGKSYTYRR